MSDAAQEPTARHQASRSSLPDAHSVTARLTKGDDQATVASDQLDSTDNLSHGQDSDREITKNVRRQNALASLPRRSLGSVNDDYELLEELGSGGMATVQLARQANLRRLVAVKRLRTDTPEQRQRMFLAEAMITASLDHHNIIPIYDMGMDQDGVPFYAMKVIRGRSWEDAMPMMDFREKLKVLMRVCDGVAYAHGQGILHRDLKPANIMLGRFKEVRVMDWGLAERQELSVTTGGISQNRMMVGTPAYMAPEMARGDLALVDERTDVYLLGGCLFHMLTGLPPHDGGGEVKACLRAAAENRLQAAWQDVDPEHHAYVSVMRKALSTDPTRRYQSVDQLVKALLHAERFGLSRQLTVRARRLMRSAMSSQDYDTFARAIYCCEEALANWGGNDDAIELLSEVQMHYAQVALVRGDYDLAESMVHPGEPLHQDVCRQLRELRQSQ